MLIYQRVYIYKRSVQYGLLSSTSCHPAMVTGGSGIEEVHSFGMVVLELLTGAPRLGWKAETMDFNGGNLRNWQDWLDYTKNGWNDERSENLRYFASGIVEHVSPREFDAFGEKKTCHSNLRGLSWVLSGWWGKMESMYSNVGNPGCHKPTIWGWFIPPMKMVILRMVYGIRWPHYATYTWIGYCNHETLVEKIAILLIVFHDLLPLFFAEHIRKDRTWSWKHHLPKSLGIYQYIYIYQYITMKSHEIPLNQP